MVRRRDFIAVELALEIGALIASLTLVTLIMESFFRTAASWTP
jgi:hypothetical protein